MKIDQALLKKERSINSNQNNLKENIIKRVLKNILQLESKIYLPFLLLISLLSKEKEELVIILSKKVIK